MPNINPFLFFSVPEFLRATFREPAPDADMFSGQNILDVIVRRPRFAWSTGKLFTLIIPDDCARLHQVGRAVHTLPAEKIRYCVAERDSLTIAHMNEILRDANGYYLDLNALTVAHRAMLRSLPLPLQDVDSVLGPERNEAAQ